MGATQKPRAAFGKTFRQASQPGGQQAQEKPMLTLDHVAIGAEDLADGTAATERALGVDLDPGGQHPAMATHNRLLSLGPEYLEVIAIDPTAPAPPQPRWFDLDSFAGPPRPAAWICRCDDLEAALARAPDGTGRPYALARGDLRWRMAVPETGKLPFGGLFPALMSWEGAAHPAPRLTDRGLRLAAVVLHSPEAAALEAALARILSDPRVTVRPADTPRLELRLATPGGTVSL
jgi:hypothetical protein